MSSWHGSVIDFNSFHPEIEKAIDQNQMYASVLIKESDKQVLIPEIQTWLIRRLGTFSIVGYLRDERLSSFFDYDVMIEEFDDLYLLFRDYLRLQKGLNPDSQMTLMRFRDNLTFIPFEGIPNDNAYYRQHDWGDSDLPEMELESDPFLPTGGWVYQA